MTNISLFCSNVTFIQHYVIFNIINFIKIIIQGLIILENIKKNYELISTKINRHTQS